LPKKKNLKKKKKSDPFWKKKPELERITRHIGKLIDRIPPEAVSEIGLNAALAYAGYQVWKDWKGALFGPIALRLARSPGGTPPVSQMAGVAGLTYLGLCFTGGGFGDFLIDPVGSFEREGQLLRQRGGVLYVPPKTEVIDGETVIKCDEGMVRMKRSGYPSICVDEERIKGYERWGWSRA